MKTILTTDWAPRIEAAARQLGQVCAVVYCFGWVLGAWVHRTSAQLAQLWRRLLVPAAPYMASVTLLAQWDKPAPVIVQRFAIAAVPARCNIAPPAGVVHIGDPMARAVRLVRSGMSQRQAASLCGISRSSLQRALKR